MSDTRFFRKYLDILNEGPPPGVGPNAPVRPATPPPANPNQEPSQYQQAKDAVGQQIDNYKEISKSLDQGVKQGAINQDVANQAKSFTQGAMMRGGYEAGKAALGGKRDPSSAYVGSMMKSMGDVAANSGLDDAMKKIGPEMNKYRGPNAQDIRNDPAFKKASPEQQAQALKDFEAIRNISDEDWAYYTSGNAIKQGAAQAKQAGQDMIDQKDWGTGGSAGFSPKTNELFGLDPTRQATDAEMQAAATGTQPTQPAPAQPAPAQPTQPQGAQQPTTEEKDDMDNRQLMRKYMDYLDEAPATAINPNDKNAASFGKQINAPVSNTNTNIDTRATAQRDKLAQQMASGKINAPASQTVNPNQQYGGGYDPSKVKYADGGATSSGYTAQSQAQKTAPVQQAVNNQSSGYTAQSQAQNTRGASTNATAPTFTGMAGNPQQNKGASAQRAAEPSLASQYVAANQPQSATTAKPAPATAQASAPSLASQYVSANQPKAAPAATASTTQPTSDVLATQALNAQDQGISGQSKGIPAGFGQVAEEKSEDSDDELLKSIIRLIKQ